MLKHVISNLIRESFAEIATAHTTIIRSIQSPLVFNNLSRIHHFRLNIVVWRKVSFYKFRTQPRLPWLSRMWNGFSWASIQSDIVSSLLRWLMCIRPIEHSKVLFSFLSWALSTFISDNSTSAFSHSLICFRRYAYTLCMLLHDHVNNKKAHFFCFNCT